MTAGPGRSRTLCQQAPCQIQLLTSLPKAAYPLIPRHTLWDLISFLGQANSSRRRQRSHGKAEVFVGLASFRGVNGAVPDPWEAHIQG
ncbi:hypothetical protein E2C01_021827 [Portunus trituberculatus]|uniref:Uncharacterized protein n=1 Tax=Portunus trituberculatus TaxID=210409 RepID=A0A5B7E5E3_PORTR|nr:hypothetical protein [Portunus trituberculatus]